jgi:integrase
MQRNSIAPAPDGKPERVSKACQSDKPRKPYPDFPLFPHATRRWAKKIRGQLHYFGPWNDPDGALEKYLHQKDALHAGRKPRLDPEGFTVKELVNAFLNEKAAAREAGEIAPRTWQDYKESCDIIISHFGKRRLVADIGPDDFFALRKKLANKWGPRTLVNVITRIRVAFKYASDNDLIDRPVVYGSAFKRPSKKTLRIDRAKKGPKLFSRDEVRAMLEKAGGQLKAMILLGINCGFGNADCGTLPQSAVDLDGAIIDYPRPKTGIARRCILWPETVQAIREVLGDRPAPKNPEHAGLVFVTKYGAPWAKLTTDNTLAKEVGKLLRGLKINGRTGLGFYTLRHVFRTVADEAKDQPACDYIMGHEGPHMSVMYRETIGDDRLRAVSEHVHAWLFPP